MNSKSLEPMFFVRLMKDGTPQVHGPIPLSKIRAWASEGLVGPTTKFSRDGQTWVLELDDVLGIVPANERSETMGMPEGNAWSLVKSVKMWFWISFALTVILHVSAIRGIPTVSHIYLSLAMLYMAAGTLLWLIVYSAVREGIRAARR